MCVLDVDGCGDNNSGDVVVVVVVIMVVVVVYWWFRIGGGCGADSLFKGDSGNSCRSAIMKHHHNHH